MDINSKTSIPLAWAAAILMSIAGVISSGAVAHYRLGSLEKSWEEYRADRKDHEESDKIQELRLQRLEDHVINVDKMLTNIDDKLEQVLNGRHR